MAPELGILKRQRSRPSEWWAAKPTIASPVPAVAPTLRVGDGDGGERTDGKTAEKKTRGRQTAGGIKEAIAAGNRGRREGEGEGVGEDANSKDRKGKRRAIAVSENNTDATEKEKPLRRGRLSAGEAEIRALGLGDGEKSRGVKKDKAVLAPEGRPLRRGRSSVGEAELSILGEASSEAATEGTEGKKGKKGKKRGRPAAVLAEEEAVGGSEERIIPRRGRPAAIRVEEQADELLGDQPEVETAPKKRGRLSAGSVEEPEGVAAPKRRSRRSIVAVEDQADDELVAEAPREEAVPRKRGRRSAGQIEKPEEQEIEQDLSKKEGRPAGTRIEEPDDELVIEGPREEAVPKKMGRPFTAPTGEEAEEQLPTASRKRDRPAIADTPAEIVPEVPEPRKRRTRQSDAEIIEQEADSVPIGNTPARGRTRHRRSNIVEQELAQPKDQEKRAKNKANQSDVQAEKEDIGDTGRRRARRSDIGSQQTIPEPVAKDSSKSTNSSRRSEIVEVETASSRLTKNRGDRGSKPSSNTAPAKKTSSSTQISTMAKKATRLSNAASSAPSQTHKKGSKRISQVDAPKRKRKGVENTEPAPSKRQRIEKAPEHGQNDEAEVGLLNYQHLKVVTRNVSRQTIEAKWEALPPTAVDRISQLLSDLQRPVVARLNDERKKTEAGTAVEAVSRKLVKKISRGLPFPPGTRNHREDDFDFENILDHNRALEAQLTPALHSNELLEAELSKEMAKLESDKDLLAELETNAKAEASVRNQAARKLHSVLQTDDSTGERELMKDDIGLKVNRQFQPLDLGVPDDENLQALVEELDGHVDSIQGNIKQVQGISLAMANSRAAVQATLFDHLDNSLYADVILGAE